MLFQRSSSSIILLATAVTNVLGNSVHRPAGIGRRGGTPNLPYDPSTTTKCEYWYDNETGSLTCSEILDTFGVSLAELRALNPILTASCGGFAAGKAYCVLGEPDGKAKPTTTTPSPTKSTTKSSSKPATTSSIKKTTTSKAPTKTTKTTTITTTKTTTGNGIKTPTPTHPGLASNCDAFVLVAAGDTCASLAKAHGITVAQFAAWNTGVGGEACRGMWASVYACVSVVGHTATKAASNGVATPAPVRAGMTKSCKAFHMVRKGETCATLAERYKVKAADIVKWNPDVGSACAGLWVDTYACVGVL